MSITIDTTAVIAVINGEPTASSILAATQNVELIAPASLPWEIINAFSAMFKRRAITEDVALRALGLYPQMGIRLIDVSLEQSLRLSANLNIYAYDAFVLACAVDQRTSILTLDRGLRHAANRLGVPTVGTTPWQSSQLTNCTQERPTFLRRRRRTGKLGSERTRERNSHFVHRVRRGPRWMLVP